MPLLLMSVSFTHPVSVPGVSSTGGGLTEFPPKTWAAIEGWSMRVVGERLEIVSPPGLSASTLAKPEYVANGIDERQAVGVVTVPLHLCILRYGGVPGADIADEPHTFAPTRPKIAPTVGQAHLDAATALATVPGSEAGPPVDFAALNKATLAPPAAPKPPDPPRRPPMPQPAARRPPGARGPSKPTNIVRDVDDVEAEAVTASKAERPKLETRPAFGGEGDEPAEVDLD